jgi:uncharacterized protein YijF (DUF1287 family)
MAQLRTTLLTLCAVGCFSQAAAAEPPATFGARLAAAAAEQAQHRVVYDPSYVAIPYPWGDVPADRGVCADVVVRAYRALGVDLQQRVHEDMTADFAAYPAHWGLSRPDPNIDHRRVLNLETFFSRHGERLLVSDDPADYRAGDLVTWNLRDALAPSGRPLVAHNVGQGPQVEDVLFAWPMSGRYRYEVPAGEDDRL